MCDDSVTEMKGVRLTSFLVQCSLWWLCVWGGKSHYKDGEKVVQCVRCCVGLKCHSPLQVVMYVNKVGPYFNPQETYHYYALPICRPSKVGHTPCGTGVVMTFFEV